MKKIPVELIKQYKERKINRAEIAERTGCIYSSLNKILKVRGIELWDNKKRTRSQTEEIINLYVRKEKTREDLCKLYHMQPWNLLRALRDRNINIWDGKQKNNKKKDYDSKNFSWKEFKNHYFFNYNK